MKKTPKTTKRRKTATRRSSVAVPPPGLALALRFADTAEGWRAAMSAAEVYPHAVRMIDILQNPGRNEALPEFEKELQRAARTSFGAGMDEDYHGTLLSAAAFELGFATCWLVMAQINGGGAR